MPSTPLCLCPAPRTVISILLDPHGGARDCPHTLRIPIPDLTPLHLPARDAEVLSLFAMLINRLKDGMRLEVPRIFEAVFEPTLQMITKNFEVGGCWGEGQGGWGGHAGAGGHSSRAAHHATHVISLEIHVWEGEARLDQAAKARASARTRQEHFLHGRPPIHHRIIRSTASSSSACFEPSPTTASPPSSP